MSSKKYNEFMQPFDGTQPPVSPEEQQAVTTTFNSFVDDTLLRFAGDVKTYNSLDSPQDSLLLRLPEGGGIIGR